MYRLSREMTEGLLRKPESGMGYQLVTARMGDYELAAGVVLGARILLLDAEREEDRILLRTAIQRGIAQPAFGRAGGGVEVIFPDGTQPQLCHPAAHQASGPIDDANHP